MPQNAHFSSLEAANLEIENLQEQGVTDIHTLLNAGIIAYSLNLLGVIEPIIEGLQKQATNAKRLLGFSMILNGLFTILTTIHYFWRH